MAASSKRQKFSFSIVTLLVKIFLYVNNTWNRHIHSPKCKSLNNVKKVLTFYYFIPRIGVISCLLLGKCPSKDLFCFNQFLEHTR